MPTDIAFTLAILALASRNAPPGLRSFVLSAGDRRRHPDVRGDRDLLPDGAGCRAARWSRAAPGRGDDRAARGSRIRGSADLRRARPRGVGGHERVGRSRGARRAWWSALATPDRARSRGVEAPSPEDADRSARPGGAPAPAVDELRDPPAVRARERRRRAVGRRAGATRCTARCRLGIVVARIVGKIVGDRARGVGGRRGSGSRGCRRGRGSRTWWASRPRPASRSPCRCSWPIWRSCDATRAHRGGEDGHPGVRADRRPARGTCCSRLPPAGTREPGSPIGRQPTWKAPVSRYAA